MLAVKPLPSLVDKRDQMPSLSRLHERPEPHAWRDRPTILSGRPDLRRLRAPGGGGWSEEIRRDNAISEENRHTVKAFDAGDLAT